MPRSSMPQDPPPNPARQSAKLGTFAGVFTPSILTILGIILFQRLGFIVGAGGLTRALLIIAVATAISVVTSVSLAAIATNLRVKGGGDYYLISRTLGVHYGGAIGLVLFLAQSVSIAFYCIGFGEAVAAMLGVPGDKTDIAGIAAVATIAIGAIAYLGADLATKFQYVVMTALAGALIAFFIGGAMLWNTDTLTASTRPPPVSTGVPFWVLFAIFFPAVTGFTQGVSMSGDLRDAAKSLPRGTFWAVGISTLIYVLAAVVFASALPLERLAADYSAMRRVAIWPWLIEAGVIAATLSSAMASFLGAPRILQSLAKDNILPPLRPFAAGSGPSNNPRRATLFAGAVALATIALGSLNAVATVVGMCFLLSYGLLNYATFFEARAHSPAFRPTFRFFNAWVSLGGAALCLAAGIMISPVAAALAGALMVALHQYLRRAAPHSPWADSRYAYHFRRVRDHLTQMRHGSEHPRDWRPFVIALCNDPIDRGRLLRFASWIDGDSGFTTALRILTPDASPTPDRLDDAEEALHRQVVDAGENAFARVVAAPTVAEGLGMAIQAHGLGSLHPNTILMSAHEQFGAPVRRGDAPPPVVFEAAIAQGRNLILLHAGLPDWDRIQKTPHEARRIDVWWKDDATSRLCLLLAHLMTRSDEWRDAAIHVRLIADGPAQTEQSLADVRAMLADVRIEAEADAVDVDDSASLVERSKETTIAFLPLRVRGGRLVGPKGFPLVKALDGLPTTALVVSGEDIDLNADADAPASTDADAGVNTNAESPPSPDPEVTPSPAQPAQA